MGLNDLTIEVYSSGTTRIYDPGNEIINAEGLRFSTIYPGGLYGDCSLQIPRNVAKWWELNGGKRLVVRNGMKIVWEGQIDNLVSAVDSSAAAVEIKAVGFWGTILGRRRWMKPWCDMRLEQHIWYDPYTAWSANDQSLLQLMTIDRVNRLRFTPKPVAFSTNWYCRLRYYVPTGETIKRVAFSYDLQEAGQQWSLLLYNEDTSTVEWSVSVSGASTADVTLATPTKTVFFYLRSDANQTPPEDGTVYGEVSNVKVYTETGSINLTEIAKDIVAKFTTLNASTAYIGSNTLALEPFITDGHETAAEILEKAASFGDSSYYQWYASLLDSELAATPDGKPVLYVGAALLPTNYEYIVRIEELDPSFSFDRYFDELWNNIIVRYTNEVGKEFWITPADDATLTNAASVAAYGQRDYELKVDTASATTAANLGRTFLAEHKDPKYRMSGAIQIKGSVRTQNWNTIPACQIRAGYRMRIENYLQDLSGTGLTFVIGQTSYDAESEVCSISAGSDLAGELRKII